MAQLCSDCLIRVSVQLLVLGASFVSMDVHRAAWQVTDLLQALFWASCCGANCRSIQQSPWRSIQCRLGMKITMRQLENEQSMTYRPCNQRTQVKERGTDPNLIGTLVPFCRHAGMISHSTGMLSFLLGVDLGLCVSVWYTYRDSISEKIQRKKIKNRHRALWVRDSEN